MVVVVVVCRTIHQPAEIRHTKLSWGWSKFSMHSLWENKWTEKQCDEACGEYSLPWLLHTLLQAV